MTEEIRQFLNDNKIHLQRDNFDAIRQNATHYSRPGTWGSVNIWPDVYEVFTSNGIYPLDEMQFVPGGFFEGVKVKKLVIPRNIEYLSEYAINDCGVISIWIENPNIKIHTGAMQYLPKLQSLNFPQGMTSIPGFKLNNVPELKIIRVPESVVRIAPQAFQYIPDDCVIVTPYRESISKKLNVSDSEIEFYKQHLRFTHAPKDVEVEDEI